MKDHNAKWGMQCFTYLLRGIFEKSDQTPQQQSIQQHLIIIAVRSFPAAGIIQLNYGIQVPVNAKEVFPVMQQLLTHYHLAPMEVNLSRLPGIVQQEYGILIQGIVL